MSEPPYKKGDWLYTGGDIYRGPGAMWPHVFIADRDPVPKGAYPEAIYEWNFGRSDAKWFRPATVADVSFRLSCALAELHRTFGYVETLRQCLRDLTGAEDTPQK